MWSWFIVFLLLFIALFYFSNLIIKIIIGFILFILRLLSFALSLIFTTIQIKTKNWLK